MSHDAEEPVGHPVLMGQPDEKIAESEWREAFRQRIRQAQGKRTQEQMAKLLGISRDSWAKIVGARGDVFPIRLLTKFCAICDVNLVELLDGPDEGETTKPVRKPAHALRKRAG